uniref:Glucosamine 6-phosphate N-acetyltransferase n=1 Tax=Eptatretus burgeri TaxID=7764 RepID=A0A8C4Q0W4_EPTBU
MALNDTPLFDEALLRNLTVDNGVISESNMNGLLLRPLCTRDYDKGFMNTLAQLTDVGDVSPEMFIDRFEEMKRLGNHYVVVVENTQTGSVVATALLILERKFIHACTTRGRVEDVVVCNSVRGKGLGKLLISTLTVLAEKLGCYKVTLECRPAKVPFYERFGYNVSEELYMQYRFGH